MYAQLGTIKFEALKGLSAFALKGEQSIAEHEIIDGKPRLQNAGSKADELSLGIHLNSQFTVCKTDYNTLKTSKENGEALSFIGGDGTYYGYFVIKSMEVLVNNVMLDGTWADIDIALTLAEDFYAGASQVDQFATIDKMPVTSTGTIPLSGDPALIMGDVHKISTGANGVQSDMDKAKKFAQNANSWMDKATQKLSSVNSSINSLHTRLINSLSIGSSGAALLNQIISLQSSIGSLSSYTTTHDLQNSLLNNVLFQGQITQMFTNAAPLSNMIALRK
jgi:phage protein U